MLHTNIARCRIHLQEPNPPCLTACRDAEHGEREGDPRPRYDEHHVDAAWVDYLRLDSPQSVYTALNTVWAHQPVLLRGTPLVTGLVGRWSFQHLVRHFRWRAGPGVVGWGGEGAHQRTAALHCTKELSRMVRLWSPPLCCLVWPSAASSTPPPLACSAGAHCRERAHAARAVLRCPPQPLLRI